MPLSDDERRRLEELEKQLSAQDPSLARDLEDGKPADRVPRRRVFASLAVLVGLALVIAGVVMKMPVIGVIGFVLQCAGAYWLPVGPGLYNQNTGFRARFRNRNGKEPL